MKNHNLPILGSLLACMLAAAPVHAKDKPVSLEECPAPVQAVIRQYQAQGTFEEVARDDKKKSGGPAVYEAKFTLTDGRRIEVHISPAGSVLTIEETKKKE